MTPSSPLKQAVSIDSSSSFISILTSCLKTFDDWGLIAFLSFAALDTNGGGVEIFEARRTGSL